MICYEPQRSGEMSSEDGPRIGDVGKRLVWFASHWLVVVDVTIEPLLWVETETIDTRKAIRLLVPSSNKDRALPSVIRYLSLEILPREKMHLTVCIDKCFKWNRWSNCGCWWKLLVCSDWWVDWCNREWSWGSRREKHRLLDCVRMCSNDWF